jgi:hypothetical protein
MIETRADDLQAILDLSGEAAMTAATAPRDPHTIHARRTLRRWWPSAAAAALALAGATAWLWFAAPGEDNDLTDNELARLDAEVEVALVRLGRVLHEAERIALGDVLGTNAMN